MKLSRQALLVEPRFAERCERLMAILTPDSLAALYEVHGRFDEAGLHGPREMGRIGPLHRCANGVDLEQVAEHDLRAECLQRIRSSIMLVNHRADAKPKRQRLPHCRASRISGGACHKDCSFDAGG